MRGLMCPGRKQERHDDDEMGRDGRGTRPAAISGSPHQRRRRCATRADKREERDAALAEMEWRLRKPEGDCCPEKAERRHCETRRQRPAAQYRLGTQKMPERGD